MFIIIKNWFYNFINYFNISSEIINLIQSPSNNEEIILVKPKKRKPEKKSNKSIRNKKYNLKNSTKEKKLKCYDKNKIKYNFNKRQKRSLKAQESLLAKVDKIKDNKDKNI